MLKNDARNDASFNKRENWTKIEKIVNFIYYPNKIDPFVKNGFFSENLFVRCQKSSKPKAELIACCWFQYTVISGRVKSRLSIHFRM